MFVAKIPMKRVAKMAVVTIHGVIVIQEQSETLPPLLAIIVGTVKTALWESSW